MSLSWQLRLYLIQNNIKLCLYHWFFCGINHNDLKLDNILICQNRKNLKLCNFGHSTTFSKSLNYPVGTQIYRAPEINESAGRYNSFSAEIFSLGSVLFAIIFGKMPFTKHASSEDPLYKMVIQDQFNEFFDTHLKSLPADAANGISCKTL